MLKHRLAITSFAALAAVATIAVAGADPGAALIISMSARSPVPARQTTLAPGMAPLEMLYANFVDAAGALMVIDSGLRPRFDEAGRRVWKARFDHSLLALNAALSRVSESSLGEVDRRAVAAMRNGVAEHAAASAAPSGDCAAAGRRDAGGRELRTALYACFSSVGDKTEFEGSSYSRMAALQLLEHIEPEERRRALFLAMQPLWQAINADDAIDSPYRRMLRAEVGYLRQSIGRAERSLGLDPGAGERWLQQALEAWSARLGTEPVEPWDMRYAYSRAARRIEACTPRQALQAVNTRYYSDLGAHLGRLGIIEDLANRRGMAPIDFTDFARIGRSVGNVWTPAIPYVSIIWEKGGLSAANELAHEDGHAVHYAAIRARPSLAMPDEMNVVVEAIADVPAWSVFSPAWQHKYLGCSSDAAEAADARLGYIALDMAWGLFEIRMAQDPARDPNALWTEITRRYLHIAPHTEWSWWAVRGQLVDDPGYMLNYALGAFVTADLRARITAQIGGFDTGNPRWYDFLSEHLLRFGGELPPQSLLQQFLGRPVNSAALLADFSPSARR